MAKNYPKKVNSYNQFILSLDNKNKPIINNSLKIPLQIKDLIKNRNTIYDNNIYLNNDNLFSEYDDPNIFKNENNLILPSTNNNNIPENWFPLIKNVSIRQNIETLDDLLNLIKNNPLEPDIQYNINMKLLYDIKEPLDELNNMIGLKELKMQILEQILYFIQGLHINKNTEGDYMHTIIYGPPGTGKTEVAKIIGKIYCKIGILNKGIFKKVTRSDLIAGYLGQTAIKTTNVIDSCLGGVLFIDEVYSLGNVEGTDIYAKECIDILCEALSNHKNNLMVIIAGYEEEIKNCFFSYNQGLDSRFNWRFKIKNYTGIDLYKIFLKKIDDIGWSIDNSLTSQWFDKNIKYFEYFGRDIEILLLKTKIAHSKRVFCLSNDIKKIISMDDLNEGLKLYLKNENITCRITQTHFKKELQSTIYC
jgi:SpoVK/Ycf46/Vps4 family AAA+-type ATPase